MRRTMMISLLVSAFTIAAIGVNVVPAAAAPLGFTVDRFTGDLWSVDLTTGADTDIGATDATTVEGLALACGGALYAIDSEVDELVTINTTTGATSTIGDLNVNSTNGGLTFGVNGTLYMAAGANFYTVNITTGQATLVGPFGGELDIVGLATHPNGTIYGVDRFNSKNLYTINTSTGAATQVGPNHQSNNPNVVALDFDAAGNLWGLTDTEGPSQVVSFNLTTGIGTIGVTLDHARGLGLAIAPTCPPTTTTTTTRATSTSTSTSTTSSSTTTSSTTTSSTTTTKPPTTTTTTTTPAVAAEAVQVQPALVG